MDKLHGKKLRLEEGTKEEIQFDLLRTSLTMSNWKTPGHDRKKYFKKFTSIHDINEYMSTKSAATRMDDQRKDHVDPKGPK